MNKYNKFGVFEEFNFATNTKEIHVMPCDLEGLADPSHKLSSDCSCKPRIETENNVSIYVHRDVQQEMLDDLVLSATTTLAALNTLLEELAKKGVCVDIEIMKFQEMQHAVVTKRILMKLHKQIKRM